MLLNTIHQDFALGHVARDFREANDVTGVVAKRRNHNVGPEPGTVFPDAPAFTRVLTFFARSLQDSTGKILLDALGSVEAGKGVAANSPRRVAFDSLCAGIPAGDHALRIQGIDGVIL